jgi:hypothetical protein
MRRGGHCMGQGTHSAVTNYISTNAIYLTNMIVKCLTVIGTYCNWSLGTADAMRHVYIYMYIILQGNIMVSVCY